MEPLSKLRSSLVYINYRVTRYRTLPLATSFAFSLFLLLSDATAGMDCEAALSLHQQGAIGAAIERYEACLKTEPGNVLARSNFGAALAHEGRFAEAIEQDRKALQSAPPAMETSLRMNLGLAYYKSGRIAEAAQEFQSLLQQQPSDRRLTILVSQCELMVGHTEAAIALLKPLENAHPDDRTVAYLMGSALLKAGDIANGQKALDRILRNGDSAEGHMLLGVTMFQAGDYPGAVRELAVAEKTRPDLPSLESYFGQALLNTGDATAAAAAFVRELEHNVADFEANLRLGEIRVARKQFADARPVLERAAQIRPESAEAHRALANAYSGLHLEKEAERERKAGGAEQHASEDDGPKPGSIAPAFALRRAGAEGLVSLGDLTRKGPLVAVFGSYTCPQLRAAAPALNELYRKFGGSINFALIYVSEAHGNGDWQSTINDREKVDLAKEQTVEDKTEHAQLCLRKLAIPYQALIDGLGRETEKAYAAWPSRVYVIGRDGRVRYRTRLSELDFDRDALTEAVRAAQAAH